MIKVILIDDEEIITNGLVDFVKWEKYNMEVIGVATDGRKGLALTKSLKPDIVITDIKMPHLDGLDFISEAKNYIPNGIFVFISGYDNFHFAQKAIRLGAFDYILKPIDLDQFHDLLEKISERVKKTSEESGSLSEFYTELIYNENNDRKILEKLETLGLNEEQWYQVILFEVDFHESEVLKLNYILDEIKPENYHGLTLVLKQISSNEFIAVCSSNRRIDIEDNVSSLLHKIRKHFENLHCSETAGVGALVQSISEVQKSYKSARDSLKKKYVLGKNIDISYDALTFSDDYNIKIKDQNEYIHNIIDDVKYLKENKLRRDIGILKEEIKNSPEPQHNVNILITDILSGVINMLEELNVHIESLDINPMHENIELLKSDTFDEAINGLLNILDRIILFLHENKSEKDLVFEIKVRDYINENYMRPELSLSDLAEYTSFSQNYFTLIFKECFNKTFVEYLTEKRLDKAKELLLLSNLKISEISLKAGYDNPSYFSSVFKKKTGFSPNDFRSYAFEYQNDVNSDNIANKAEEI